MKSLLVIVLSYLLVITIASEMMGIGTFGVIICMFAVAFFDNVLGRKKILAVVTFLTLWTMADGTVPWAIQMQQTMIGAFAPPPPEIAFTIYIVLAVSIMTGFFVSLIVVNLSEVCLLKFLIKRWKLKERCGNIHG